MKLRHIMAATALLAAIGTRAQAPQFVIVHNPEVDLSQLKVDKDGFYVLFDGTSTFGWRGYAKDYLPPKWEIQDGTLHLKGPGGGEGGNILFAHQFSDFIFEIEWKISEAGNSGIFYLGKEVATIVTDEPKTEEFASADGSVKVSQTVDNRGKLYYWPMYTCCPECQVLDNERHGDAKAGARPGIRQSSSVYDMIAANPQNAKPAGEWNKVRIVFRKGRVTHYQNDVKVLSYDIWGKEWLELLRKSKFGPDKWPLAYAMQQKIGGDGKKGYFGLQDHGDEVWYRNIRVKELK